ncbi:MAG: OmpA family protein [Nitrospinae bacterium]|nr:OmpA family protein [Nitrospinota bacterium]
MAKVFRLLLPAFLLILGTASAQTDVEGSKDHPMFTRMPGFFIEDYQASDFDSNQFIVNAKVDWEEKSVEGKKTTIYYTLKEGAKESSSLQIVRNFQKAAEKIGGKKLYESEDPGARRLTMMVPGSGGKETWVQVESSGPGGYVLTVIEKGDLKQDITANEMLDALNKDGHVALYINFDTGKATMKPDSAPIIEQIAAMMKSAPSLKLAVEGHTDNVGDAKKNKKLSEDRANAVAQAIVAKGIDKGRMTSAGFGAEKPVDDNKTESGRAKNRRVELVKK